MALPLDTALYLALAVPGALALAQAKDPGTRLLGGALVGLALIVVLGPAVDLRLGGLIGRVLGLTAAVLAVIVAVRTRRPIEGTVLVVAGALLALVHLGAVSPRFATV